ncbi:hypothetical protein ACFE04_011549 [Oxalis oulophora]
MDYSSKLLLSFFVLLFISTGVFGATFTFINKCENTLWPGVLANAGSPKLETTGFELQQGASRTVLVPTGWSGRFWARTGCNFDSTSIGSCLTADCGSGQIECNGLGASPPATLAEFTLGIGSQDFYDVSLVDGYNVPMIIEASGGSGLCASTGCNTDLNIQCPAELRVGEGNACKSACEAFGSPEYCCSGLFNSPATCKPSVYSTIFKTACPRSYSYAYDDATSTFTCTAADYTLTFCPSNPSQKSASFSPPATSNQGTGSDPGLTYSGSGTGTETYPGYGAGTNPGFGAGTNPGYGSGTGSNGETAVLADGSWLAGLAMGEASPIISCSIIPMTIISLLYVLL